MIHISKMTGKLEGFKSISTNTVTNKYCIKQNKKKDPNNICTWCYSHSMLNTYRKSVATALQRNSDIIGKRILHPDGLPTILDAYFRFNSHGELINEINLINYINIAKKNSHCNFSLWTKRFDIVKKYFDAGNEKPKNFILIYSNAKINNILSKPPKYFDKTFNNVQEDLQKEKQNCTGQKCKDCLLCYKLDTTNTIVEKVKTYGKK
tara:strand:- start:279 stop:899 length:621 start_codon:yes stop_codon:yes gene_type:complete